MFSILLLIVSVVSATGPTSGILSVRLTTTVITQTVNITQTLPFQVTVNAVTIATSQYNHLGSITLDLGPLKLGSLVELAPNGTLSYKAADSLTVNTFTGWAISLHGIGTIVDLGCARSSSTSFLILSEPPTKKYSDDATVTATYRFFDQLLLSEATGYQKFDLASPVTLAANTPISWSYYEPNGSSFTAYVHYTH